MTTRIEREKLFIFLRKLINEKIVTETDMSKTFGMGSTLDAVDSQYKMCVSNGCNIFKRVLTPYRTKGKQNIRKGKNIRLQNAIVIYYIK